MLLDAALLISFFFSNLGRRDYEPITPQYNKRKKK